MKIIGITGKSGSGKTTLSTLLSKKLDCNVVDVDKIGHEATQNCEIVKKLCETFGIQILEKDGKIDRKKLGNIVFADKEKMNILTDITWGYMQNILDEILQKEEKQTIILEWALLPISKYWDNTNIKILMTAKDNERKEKVIERDKISEEYFLKRDSNAIDYTKYQFDYIFENDYKLETIEKIAKTIIK